MAKLEHLTPAEMAKACEVSVDTLRYYEREGLLEPVARNSGGQRRFSAEDVAWVRILRCLRVTAMPIRQMKVFAELVRQGDRGIPARLELLTSHREVVERKLLELEHALTVIDEKIDAYSTATGATPHAAPEGSRPRPTIDGQGARA